MSKIQKYNPIIWITLVCLLSQIMLLLCTGIWREDWLIQTMSLKELIAECSESALVINAFIFYPLLQLPDYGLRIVIFLTFLVGTLFFYGFLLKTSFFPKETCFWIVLLYSTAPVNDAKIMIICYPYTISLCLFWIGAYLAAMQENNINDRKKTVIKYISLICLFFSFFTESLLVFSAIILLFFLFYGYREKGVKAFLLRIGYVVINHFEYILLPIVFFGIKHTFFKPYGTMVHYNSPSWYTLFRGIWLLPNVTFKAFYGLLQNSAEQINLLSIGLIMAIIFILWYRNYRKKIKNKEKTESVNQGGYKATLIAGVICFILGVFPYLVIRQENYNINWLGGKDAILLAPGFALILVSLIYIFSKKKLCRMILVFIPLILGIFHANKMYLYYQDDWYHQLQLMSEIKTNEDILNNDTFLVIYSEGSYHDTTRYYTMNGGGYMATGEENRFFLSDPSMIKWLDNMPEWAYRRKNHMKDYILDDGKLDGVIFFNDKYMGTIRLLQMKFWEMFDHNKFEYEINKTKDIRYVKLDDRQYEIIHSELMEGCLTEAFIRDLCD